MTNLEKPLSLSLNPTRDVIYKKKNIDRYIYINIDRYISRDICGLLEALLSIAGLASSSSSKNSAINGQWLRQCTLKSPRRCAEADRIPQSVYGISEKNQQLAFCKRIGGCMIAKMELCDDRRSLRGCDVLFFNYLWWFLLVCLIHKD